MSVMKKSAANQLVAITYPRSRFFVQVNYFRVASHPSAVRSFTIDGQQVAFVRETTRELVRS
jgi:hypothetical protein